MTQISYTNGYNHITMQPTRLTTPLTETNYNNHLQKEQQINYNLKKFCSINTNQTGK